MNLLSARKGSGLFPITAKCSRDAEHSRYKGTEPDDGLTWLPFGAPSAPDPSVFIIVLPAENTEQMDIALDHGGELENGFQEKIEREEKKALHLFH